MPDRRAARQPESGVPGAPLPAAPPCIRQRLFSGWHRCVRRKAPRHREWRRAEVNAGLTAMIAEAFAIRNQLLSGSDASIEAMIERLGMGKGHLTSLVRLSYLGPDIVRALGRQPIELTPTRLLRLSTASRSLWSNTTLAKNCPQERSRIS
jgi:hypothetical protein